MKVFQGTAAPRSALNLSNHSSHLCWLGRLNPLSEGVYFYTEALHFTYLRQDHHIIIEMHVSFITWMDSVERGSPVIRSTCC